MQVAVVDGVLLKELEADVFSSSEEPPLKALASGVARHLAGKLPAYTGFWKDLESMLINIFLILYNITINIQRSFYRESW